MSEVASTAMRTSAAPELGNERAQTAQGAGNGSGELLGGGKCHSGRPLPFASLNLKSLESEDSESESNAQNLLGSASNGVAGGVFHVGQRRRGSAETDTGTTTLGPA